MESLEDIQARHRRELRDLQGRITNKKKNATKKTRKGINDECAALERELREKHEAELRAAAGGSGGDEEDVQEEQLLPPAEDGAVNGVATQLADASLTDAPQPPSQSQPPPPASSQSPPPPPPAQQQPPKKRNRQKERLARRAAEQEEAAARAADEAAHMVDHAAVERAAMAPLIARSGRVEHAIRPDGHCLFSAVADQMEQVGRQIEPQPAANATQAANNDDDDDDKNDGQPAMPPYRAVRHAAAGYMEAHPDDFAPFLLQEEDDAGASTADQLAAHIAQIRDTAEWGGQLELSALASAYGVDIRVLHDGRSELIRPAGAAEDDEHAKDVKDGQEQQTKRPTLWLVYYRHGFGLGEHYNSLRAKEAVK